MFAMWRHERVPDDEGDGYCNFVLFGCNEKGNTECNDNKQTTNNPIP